jgi:site-specific DNA-adenine methylase
MSITEINSSIAGSTMIQMRQMIDLDMKDALNKANTDYGNPLGTTIDFSDPSALISKLEQLKNDDPQKFKSLLQDISDTLKADATASTDSSESSFLSTLSDKFAEVAQSGDLTQLQPPPPPCQQGTQQSKVAQYDSNSGSQQSLLEILMQLLAQQGSSSDSSTSTDTNDKTSSVKNLLAKALQELTNQDNTSASSENTKSVENLLAKAIQDLNGSQA